MNPSDHRSDLARPVRSGRINLNSTNSTNSTATSMTTTPTSAPSSRGTRSLAGRVVSILAALAVVVFSVASAGLVASSPAGADDDYTSYPSKPANGSCTLQLSPLETHCAIDAALDAFSPLVFTVNGETLNSTTVGGKVRLRTLPATCAPVTARYVVNGIVLTETISVAIPAISPSPCTGGPIPTVTVPTATPVVYVTATPVASPTPKAKATVVATATPTSKAKATATATATPTADKKSAALAYTGSDNGALVFAGMALIAAGAVALTVRRMTHRSLDEH